MNYNQYNILVYMVELFSILFFPRMLAHHSHPTTDATSGSNLYEIKIALLCPNLPYACLYYEVVIGNHSERKY